MESLLLSLLLLCLGALIFLKFRDEHSDCYNPKSFFGKVAGASKKFKPDECTVAHLLQIIPDTSGYRDQYIKALARQVSYADINQLEQVRACIAEYRPHLFGEIQAADINKPIF